MNVPRARRDGFGLEPGALFGERYKVVRPLGRGSEGEVYQIRERQTGIQRAAKLYFESPAQAKRRVVWSARKLEKLQHCPIVLHYHHSQRVEVGGEDVLCLIFALFDGEPLETFLSRYRGSRLGVESALRLLYELVCGIERVHAHGEYHGDVHSQNILVRRRGVHLEVKLVDFYNRGRPSQREQREDVVDAIRVLYECLGGRKHYGRTPPEVRYICAAMQRQKILSRFPTMSALRNHLDAFEWDL